VAIVAARPTSSPTFGRRSFLRCSRSGSPTVPPSVLTSFLAIGLGAVGPTPIFAKEASAALTGKKLDEANIEKAAQAAIAVASPIDDMRGTAEFRRHVVGVLTRRNVVIILMSIELILNAVNLNLVAFSRIWGLHGQVFAIFVITDAAAEAAVGLGILIAFFRNKETVNVDEIDLLKW